MPVSDSPRLSVRQVLEESRERLLSLLAPVCEEALKAQHSPLMSPMVWDLTHVGNYEEQWLLRALGAERVASAELDELHDAILQPRKGRVALPLLSPTEAKAYLREVRERVWAQRERPPRPCDERLLRGEFVYGMVAQHEHQHIETLLATLQLMEKWEFVPRERVPRAVVSRPAEPMVFVAGGSFLMGTDHEPWAYDNERGGHPVHVPSFFIDVWPVSNAQYAEFVEAGGYADSRWWSAAGWAHVQREGLCAPQFWVHDGPGWKRRRFARVEALPPDEPVQHVCWYEADAFARWSGKRLPTEAEWEKAASWSPTGIKRRFPWGDEWPSEGSANLWTGRFGPDPLGSRPEGASAYGCQQMLGEVWEWTSSDFAPYPGFESFPYREYSEVHFGDRYKVLRGGSWATHPVAMRNTFRNWDFPIRRQIFTGFRCARDA